ncbi:MAG: PD-(D/E)XK nuclease family protein [Candidatus Sumerlaeota bacterium]
MAEIRNDFSWSFSRHKTFLHPNQLPAGWDPAKCSSIEAWPRDGGDGSVPLRYTFRAWENMTQSACLRQYYWQYYGYWNGWLRDAPDDARLAYRLKKMTNLPMWLGDLVHRMIERIIGDLRNRELNSLENYQKQLRAWMNKEWMQSVDKKWRWKPKYNLNLYEHYYGVEITKNQRLEARDKAFRCLGNFMESEIFDELAGLPADAWLSMEQLEQLEVGGFPFFVKLDLATRSGGITTIYDWKTGRQTADTRRQLMGYALFAAMHPQWRVPLENQRLVAFYLDENIVEEHKPLPEDLIDVQDMILTSMDNMKGLLDSNPEENRALLENFPMTRNTSMCRACFFREICFGGDRS